MPESSQPRLDLTACEQEPIHIPGSIQPHGILLLVNSDGNVVAASDNAAELWPTSIGRPIEDLLGTRIVAAATEAASGPNARYAGQFEHPMAKEGAAAFDVFVHRTHQGRIIELERAAAQRPNAIEVLERMAETAGRMARSVDLIAASRAAAEAVRGLTGYDRVMVYRFLDDDSGQVIAEAHAEDIDPLLHHRYPASDIPRQARTLYLSNRIRVIPDVGYEPVPLRSQGEPVDLSGALFRSVSPVHIQYLKNMGVDASASVSIVHEGQLWGLIACHHRTARPIGHERREMARQVATTFEAAIHRLEEEEFQREALRLTRQREELLPEISSAATLHDGLERNIEDLLALIPAHGFALVADEHILTIGMTPSDATVEELGRWLTRPSAAAIMATRQLGRDFPAAESGVARSAGLMSLVLSRQPATILMWFRAEEIETVKWAGNPHEPLDPQAPPGALCPRRSFELWEQQVRGCSRPWRINEQDAVRRLGERLQEVGRVKALTRMNRYLDETLDAKETALVQKDLLMREVHHRVQNNLQLVTSMLRLQEREIEDAEARRQLALASDRVKSISVLHRRLWRSDDLQMVNVDTFLRELIEDLANTWGPQWNDQITIDVTPVRIPGQTALLMGVIVTELVTNAFKHAYAGEVGPIAVRASGRGRKSLVVSVADSGAGTDGSSTPGSFGSHLVRRLVQQISGELEFTANNPGTIVTLSLPVGNAESESG
jgi:light-regulated signal transduction histidine kinase (bacteriophytochrome)